MSSFSEEAKMRLSDGGFNLVLISGNRVFESKERGIRALLSLAKSGEDWSGASAADKIVGKASAMLYSLLGVSEVYAEVMSLPAKAMLEKKEFALNMQS